jgi:hypothetical protein
MSTALFNVFMNETKSDFDAANILREYGHYSNSIYHFQQSFEKAVKALYCYYRIKYDNIDEATVCKSIESYGHDTKKSSLDLLIMISKKHPRYLLKRVLIKKSGSQNIRK